jgi:response regulator RpfG family c-di-GMP phosphodiesterase
MSLQANILVVDDELGVRESLRMVLKDNYNVLTAANGQEGLEMIKEGKPSLVILDVKMPDIDGMEVLKQIKDTCPQLPVIVLTGAGTHRIAAEALKLGAADFIVKPINAGSVKQTIENILTSGDKKMFEGNPFPSTEKALKNAYLDTLRALSKVIESRDLYTKRHSELVAKYAVEIANELGLSTEEIEVMEQTALLHDIGKIGIKDTILNKPGKLNAEEWEEVKKHPLIGEELIRPFKLLHIEQTMIRHHHERFDGAGYPDKLKGEEIPIYARILAVADSFEAMVSDRPYRSKLSLEEAKKELERCKGTQFDPKVVEAFLRVLETKATKEARDEQ